MLATNPSGKSQINNDLGEEGLDAIRLKKAFDKHFPDFESEIGAIPALSEEEKAGVNPDKSVDQMFVEILTVLRRSPPTATQPSLRGYEKVAVMEFDQMVKEMIDAARQNADSDLWHLFNRRLITFTKTWASLLSADLDYQIRTVATECTLFVIAVPQDHENLMQRIVQHACAAANALKALLLGTPIVRAE